MNKYFKLVHFEFNRFWNMYLVLMGITIIVQLTGIIVSSKSYVNNVNRIMYENSLSQSEFLHQYGPRSFQRAIETLWFMGPIAICAVTLLIYLFFIWYRDWFGKNTFIYRLLMLPTSRMNLYLAKATTILLLVLGLVALQLLLLPIETKIWQSIVPADFRLDLTLREIASSQWLEVLLPASFMEFFLYYGIGLMAVCVLFTAILFERSFRWKGIVLAILYCLFAIFVFILPLLIDSFLLHDYFYPMELLVLELIAGLIVMSGSIWTGYYLLKNKIRV